MYLLDTSVLVSALTPEVHSAAAIAWIDRHRSDRVGASDWAATEVAAALSFKVRTGQLSADQRLATQFAFEHMKLSSLHAVSTTAEHFRIAAQLAARVDSGLRAGDALHLATASESASTMVTLDIAMHLAAQLFGISCELLLA